LYSFSLEFELNSSQDERPNVIAVTINTQGTLHIRKTIPKRYICRSRVTRSNITLKESLYCFETDKKIYYTFKVALALIPASASVMALSNYMQAKWLAHCIGTLGEQRYARGYQSLKQ
jgi:hypothetical protein